MPMVASDICNNVIYTSMSHTSDYFGPLSYFIFLKVSHLYVFLKNLRDHLSYKNILNYLDA